MLVATSKNGACVTVTVMFWVVVAAGTDPADRSKMAKEDKIAKRRDIKCVPLLCGGDSYVLNRIAVAR